MRVAGLIIASIVVGGCVSAKPINLPSGQQGYSVTCIRQDLGWAQCYEVAGKTCPSGYEVVEKFEGEFATLSGQASGSSAAVSAQVVTNRSMLFICKS